MTIADRINSFLKAKKITKAEAARSIGVSYRIFWHWANGKGSGNVSTTTAKKLSKMMGITLSEFYK